MAIQLPSWLQNSSVLNENDKVLLQNVAVVPTVDPGFYDDHVTKIVQYFALSPSDMEKELHKYAQLLLQQNMVEKAWQVLLVGNDMDAINDDSSTTD